MIMINIKQTLIAMLKGTHATAMFRGHEYHNRAVSGICCSSSHLATRNGFFQQQRIAFIAILLHA
jgi:hypothetical protein